MNWIVRWCLLLLVGVVCQVRTAEGEFDPSVTANCDKGFMVISVITDEPFHGIVHTRDTSDPRGFKELRRDPCITHGTGSRNTSLRLSLFSGPDDPLYCGVRRKDGTEERTVAISVRVHKALELSDDKSYVITCGKNNFRNARNELFRVSLNFFEEDKKVHELVVGHQYKLRAGVSGPGSFRDIHVKSCFSFAQNTSEVELIDLNGCPKTTFLSYFKYNDSSDTADATVSSTFRFPDSNKIHVQCDIVLCQGAPCLPLKCSGVAEPLPKALPQTREPDDAVQLMASTSVFVVEPGESVHASAITECTEWRFPWLIGLCICLAILLLVMLIVNIFLCSSLTCTCTKTEVVEKEPSEMEDYDPYKVGWAPSSHYGSRTSLNKPGYASGGSTLNSTTRSVSNGSDHYTIVHSRPNSRYSHHSSKEPLHVQSHRGQGSILSNGHYNSRI